MNEEYVYVFKALSHRSRLRLLQLLARHGELSVSELTEAMPREGSTISRHLNQLRLHGLVDVRQEGPNRYYSLKLDRVQDVFARFLDELARLQEAGKDSRDSASSL